MSQGLLEVFRSSAAGSESPAHQEAGISRRKFLKFGMTLGASAGGGMLLGFSLPAAAAGSHVRKSVVGGDASDEPNGGVFAPGAFIRIDRSGMVTLVMPKVEMGQGILRRSQC
jgi:isoquinoline 1-oxidoreductase subunit beta